MTFEHLEDNHLMYWEHWKQAMGIAWKMTKCIPQLVIHAFYPDCYIYCASDVVDYIVYKNDKIE